MENDALDNIGTDDLYFALRNKGISPDTEKMYQQFGHQIRFRPGQGSAMGIFIDQEKGLIYGAADSRAFDGKSVGW